MTRMSQWEGNSSVDRCESRGSRFVRQNGTVALGTGRHGVVAMRFVCFVLGGFFWGWCVLRWMAGVEFLAVVCK